MLFAKNSYLCNLKDKDIKVMKKVTCFIPNVSMEDVCSAGLRGFIRMFSRNGNLYFVVDKNRLADFVDDVFYKYGFHVCVNCRQK